MTLLRMLAFAPQEGGAAAERYRPAARQYSRSNHAAAQAAQPHATLERRDRAPGRRTAGRTTRRRSRSQGSGVRDARADRSWTDRTAAGSGRLPCLRHQRHPDLDWTQLLAELKIGGMARMLAQHSAAERLGRPGAWTCACPRRTGTCSRSPIGTSCRRRWRSTSSAVLRVEFTPGAADRADAGGAGGPGRARRASEAAVQAIDTDPFVRELVENFDARVVDESIRPSKPASSWPRIRSRRDWR